MNDEQLLAIVTAIIAAPLLHNVRDPLVTRLNIARSCIPMATAVIQMCRSMPTNHAHCPSRGGQPHRKAPLDPFCIDCQSRLIDKGGEWQSTPG
jgi:hypothetical protein